MKSSIIDHNGRKSITVFVDGQLLSATDDHWNWVNILAAVEDETATADMFDPIRVVTKYLQLSDRFAIRNDTITYDDDPINNSIADKIMAFIKEGLDAWPLVRFMEKLYENPSEDSRQELYAWIEASHLTITDEGNFVGYKYLYKADDEGLLRSGASGHAFVNGVEQNGYIEQRVGDTVTMPRSAVDDNRQQTCSVGLHVGTWSYVAGTGNVIHATYVNPRDVVSVPDDYGNTKMRVCRYVLGPEVTEPIAESMTAETPGHVVEVAAFDSSFIETAIYIPRTGRLEVWIHGNRYDYDIGKDTWQEFCDADSPGRYYNNVIRGLTPAV